MDSGFGRVILSMLYTDLNLLFNFSLNVMVTYYKKTCWQVVYIFVFRTSSEVHKPEDKS